MLSVLMSLAVFVDVNNIEPCFSIGHSLSTDIRGHEALHHHHLPYNIQSPGKIKSREVELGCRNRMDCLAAELFLNRCFSDKVFVTLLRTAID